MNTRVPSQRTARRPRRPSTARPVSHLAPGLILAVVIGA